MEEAAAEIVLGNLIIASLLLVTTTVIHATGMAISLRCSRDMLRCKERHPRWLLIKPLTVSSVVVLMFIASVIEVVIWAGAYTLLGAITEMETATYFSMVTFTTLGYGDIVLDARWRLLGSFQAANGIIMFGWTTAVVLAVVQRSYGK